MSGWESRYESRERIRALMEQRGWHTSDLAYWTKAHVMTAWGWIRPHSPAMPSKKFRDVIDKLIEED